MADKVLNAPPPAPKKTRDVYVNKGDEILRGKEEVPSDFLPPLSTEEQQFKRQRPGLTITRPGEKPEFAPAEEKVFDVRRQEYVEPYKKLKVPPKPDMSKEVTPFPTRDEFEQHAFKVLGGNPYEFDPHVAMQQKTSDLKPLFNYVFQNKVYWGDRDRLDPKQKEFWDATVKAYRSQVFNEAEQFRERHIEIYNHMLSKYNDETQERKAAEKKVADEQAARLELIKEQRKAQKEAKAEERAEDAAKRAEEKHKIYVEKAKETGKKAPKLGEVQAIYKDERGQLRKDGDEWSYIGGINTGEKLDPETLKQKNAARRAAGMPELIETETTETIEPTTVEKILDWLPFVEYGPIEQKTYLYVEEDIPELPAGMERVSDTMEEVPGTTEETPTGQFRTFKEIQQRAEGLETFEQLSEVFPDGFEYEGVFYIPTGGPNPVEVRLE